jgi:hypothetical protein
MAITADDLTLLRAYIGASASDDALLESAWESAVAALDEFLSSAWREVPQDVRRGLNLEVAQEFWKRREATAGSSQFAVMDGQQQVRGPRDPLFGVMPTLRRYVLGF